MRQRGGGHFLVHQGRRLISTEFELKLAAPPAKLEKLRRVLLAMPTVKSEVRLKLVSTYSETPPLALHRERLSFRVRKRGPGVRTDCQGRKSHSGGRAGILATFKEEHQRTYKDDQQAQSISWDSFAKHSAHEIGCISCADPLQDVRPVEVALTAGERKLPDNH